MGTAIQQQDLGFDPDALRDKYRRERDKRLREDGNEQYVEVNGQFARFVDDPYVGPGFEREPLADEVDVAIIGGGFGGLLAGARLREAGVESLRVIEKGGDFGGTWYWNRYPGAQCDIESYIYLPLLEELGYVPKEKYSFAPEILAHARAIGEKYRLYENACFQTEVTAMRWDEDALRWIIETNRNDAIRARFVAMSNGPLNRPKLPGIPGVGTFKGHTFHTSRWDYRYTGGDSNGNLTGLKGKRVGIIGTGATAVQCVPHVGEQAEQLYVFQRTPSSIDVRGNQPTDPSWAAALAPGWQQQRMTNFNVLVTGGLQDEDLVNDGWTDIIRNLATLGRPQAGEDVTPEQAAARVELADFKKMEQIRARVDELVDSPATAAALKPWYRQFCKRPVLPRRLSQDVQPAQRDAGGHRRRRRRAHHRARRGGERPGVRVRLPHLRHRLSRSAPPTRAAPATTSRARAASSSRTSGPAACAPCTASKRAAFRTASSWA